MDFRKIGRITILIFLGLTFAVSLYFNYLYVKNYIVQRNINENNKTIIINKQIFGTVDTISKSQIQIKNNNNEIVTVKLDEKTQYFKTFLDRNTLKIKEEQTKFEEIKKGLLLIIDLLDENDNDNLTAIKINYTIIDSLSGTTIDSSDNSITIAPGIYSLSQENELSDKNIIKISENTEYYQSVSKYNEDTGETSVEKMEKISKEAINNGDYVYAFFDKDLIDDYNQSAIKIVVQK